MNDIYDIQTIQTIREVLLKRQETIAVAESVTSGHLQAALSLADDATLFFQGGITAYNLGQKCRHLDVDPAHALTCNCVSEKVATEMATHVCNLFLSNWGVAVTGYAAPVPGVPAERLFAHYSICYKKQVLEKGMLTVNDKEGNPLAVQLSYTEKILSSLLILLRRNTKINLLQ